MHGTPAGSLQGPPALERRPAGLSSLMETRGESPFDVQRYLIRDERVVWSAQPVRKYFLKYLLSQDPTRFMGYYFIFVGLFFVLLPFVLFFSMPPGPPRKGDPPLLFFCAIGFVFAGIGYAFSFGMRRRAIRQCANTAYYLTNSRAFIVSGADRRTVTAIDLRRVPQTSLSLVNGTIGNIVFGDADPALHRGFWRCFYPWGR